MPSYILKATTISHDLGLFEFEVDNRWTRTIEEDGTQVFWDNAAGSGTLRVSSITAKKSFASAVDAVRAVLSKGCAVQVRPDGVGMVSYRRESTEDGQPTTTFWWEAAHAVPPEYVRIAFFSFTIYSNEENEPKTRRQIDFLHEHLAKVRFGPVQEFER